VSPLLAVSIAGVLLLVAARFRRHRRDTRFEFQFAVALVSLVVLGAVSTSWYEQEAMQNLAVHMIGHVVVMFLVPIGLIVGGSVRQLWWVIPVRRRRIWQRRLNSWSRHVSWRVRLALGAVSLNVVMVASHLPVVFNAAMTHMWIMQWFIEPLFLVSGLLFFAPLLTAAPRRWRGQLRWQLVAVAVTMFEMLVMAMSMSIFTKSTWYPSLGANMLRAMMPGLHVGNISAAQLQALTTSSSWAHMGGMNMAAASPQALFHQQQLAAAILWICGDFWAVPVVVLILRRAINRDGSLFRSLDSYRDDESSS
jgi:cytochrome c oxidase assembly factor CtaG